MITKYTKCLLVLLVTLKVYDLFVKKLKTIATEVDTKLLAIAGNPRTTKVKRTPKSIAVLAMPTTPKRIFSTCFFARFFTNVTFLNIVKRTVFDFFENATDIFTDYA